MIDAGRVVGHQLRLGLDPNEPVQLELDGRALPIADPVLVAIADAEAEEQARRDRELARTGSLFDQVRQRPLPLPKLHEPVGGKVKCARGYRAGVGGACLGHAELTKAKIRTETCARQRCSASAESNTSERARDAWNGTADDEADRLGLRHFGAIPWGVFVITAPYEIRWMLHGEGLRAFRRIAAQFVLTLMRAHARDPDATFYMQSWLHPVGEARLPEEGQEIDWSAADELPYHPHENILVPMVGFIGTDRRARRLKPTLPKAWMGRHGAGQLLREMLVEEFGRWWGEGKKAPTCNWFFEYRAEPEKKMHALKYFARVWPTWAKHPHVWIRPRSLELKHWRRKEDLHDLLGLLCMEPLPELGKCKTCTEKGLDPGPIAQGVGATPEAALEDLREQVERFRVTAGAPAPAYAQHRRIITSPSGVRATGPPATAPPGGLVGAEEFNLVSVRHAIWGAQGGATTEVQ